MDDIPARDVPMLMGDANCKVGKAEKGKATHGTFRLGDRNERGLVKFCEVNNLVITNTLFAQHPRRLYAWMSPDHRTRNQIDYIMVSQRWKISVKKVKTYPRADCNTSCFKHNYV